MGISTVDNDEVDVNVNVNVFFLEEGGGFSDFVRCICRLAGIPTVGNGRVDVHVQCEYVDEDGLIY